MDYGPRSIDRELQAAKRNTKERLRVYREMIRRYAGPYFKDQNVQYDPENHAYQWVTNTLVQSVFSNPKVKLESKRGGKYSVRARILQQAVDRWCEEYRLDRFLRRGPALTMNFARGVAKVSLDDCAGYIYEPGADEPEFDSPKMPCCHNVSPEDFIWDPLHDEPKDWMYCGDRKIWDKDALLERARAEPGWDMKIVEDAIAAIDRSEDARKRDGIERNEIVVWELWCPNLDVEGDENDDSGKYNGAIVTVLDSEYHQAPSESGSFEYPRKTRRYYGPKRGPYALFDALTVPGDGHPLAPLVAVEGQVRELNAASIALTKACEVYKRFIVSREKKLAAAIKSSPTDYVFDFPDFTKEMVGEFSIGGPTNELLATYEIFKTRVERNGGLSSTKTGQVATGATATADVIANAGAETRMALHNVAVEDGTYELLYRVLWYMFHENQVALLVGQIPAQTGMQYAEQFAEDPNLVLEGNEGDELWNLWWRGGDGSDETFDSLMLSLEPYAMRRTSEAEMTSQAGFMSGPLVATLQALGTMPYVDGAAYLKMLGERVGLPNLSTLLNPQALSEAQRLNVAIQAASLEQPDGPGPQTGKMMPKSPSVPESPKSPPTPTPGGTTRPMKPKATAGSGYGG